MGAFIGCQLDAGDAEHLLEPVDFNRAMDGVVVGHGDPDAQFPGPAGDGGDGVVTVGEVAVEMHVHYRAVPRQFFQVGPFERYPMGVIHLHQQNHSSMRVACQLPT